MGKKYKGFSACCSALHFHLQLGLYYYYFSHFEQRFDAIDAILVHHMWDALRARFLGEPSCDACPIKVTPARPGTVNPHNAHVLIRLEKPVDLTNGVSGSVWWPSFIDELPTVAAITDAVATDCDFKVKITVFEYTNGVGLQSPGTCDIVIFPACTRCIDVPLEQAADVVVALLRDKKVSSGIKHEALQGINFIVCCHNARDTRCGTLGPPLAAKLKELTAATSTIRQANVLMSSHIGGHLYAGNVCVYGTQHAANGNWFGGLAAPDAGAFLAALDEIPLGGDPASHERLRKWWRGNVKMTKDEQLAQFSERGCARACTEDIEDTAAT
jgi:hypothetical protein